ncbi:hypothetical protein E2C01_022321 [Portunus trituberculatus]|uniref:Uncharacterized protein n=1 Tax=Portunus trituberculatus TaxID=210409 RepID=A0A5B7E7D4_PORTR|nr:hypothetical protein [Portunus trituberculatus]
MFGLESCRGERQAPAAISVLLLHPFTKSGRMLPGTILAVWRDSCSCLARDVDKQMSRSASQAQHDIVFITIHAATLMQRRTTFNSDGSIK